MIVQATAILCFLAALFPALMILANWRRFRPAPAAERATPGDAPPSVSVLIPARNEAANIRTTLEHVLANHGVDLEVIVLDDASEDATAALVQEIADRDRRVRLAAAPPLPDGWCGKQHACQVLAESADRETLIFLDADVRLTRDALQRITMFLHQSEAQLVSGFPHQETGSLAEELIVPLIHFILLGFLPLRRMRASPYPAYGSGCGQLFATRKSEYRRAGGHAAIRASLHDGLQLPRAYRRAGMMTDVFDASDIATCRMYRGLREVWRGFAKNATEGLAAPATILPATLLLGLGHVLPPVLILLALPQGLWRPAGFWAVAALAASYLPRIALALRFRHPWRGTILHPLGIAFFLGIQWWAWLRARLGYKAGWKGRGYLPD